MIIHQILTLWLALFISWVSYARERRRYVESIVPWVVVVVVEGRFDLGLSQT